MLAGVGFSALIAFPAVWRFRNPSRLIR